MAVQIGAKPDSGFDDPIGMLKDCHRRIERFLHILSVVADSAAGRSLTEEETSAVQSALQYFRTGGQRHTADEEESLFPRLRAALGVGSLEEIGALEDEHRTANSLHQTVETLYLAWMAGGMQSQEDEERLGLVTKRLKQLYEAHIEVEERVVFPQAAEMLDSQAVTAIGEELRARRK
jgi:hemerythrin-like domain-containing protein